MSQEPSTDSEPSAPDPYPRRRPEVTLVALLVAVGVVAVSARVSVSVPGSPVPQSLQTLGVVLVGAGLGWLRGGAALVLYLLVGAVGVPVFADGGAGAAHLRGPTAGYLMGFVLAAAWVGWGLERTHPAAMSAAHSSHSPALDPARTGSERTGSLFARAFLVMVLGHVLILGLGWLRLALEYGTTGGYEAGVLPFLWGGVAKSAAGAAGWMAWTVWARRTARTSRTLWMAPSPTRDIPMNPRQKANE